VSDRIYSFVPFSDPPMYPAAYRMLSQKGGTELNPGIVDSLGDEHYRILKLLVDGKIACIAEIIFVAKDKIIFKAVKRTGAYEIFRIT